MSDERVTVSRRINASADRLFALVSDPETHVAIDGSGMLMSTPDGKPGAVGDTFIMNMDREPLGDIPDMGKYTVCNTVTRYEPGAAFEWTVGGEGKPPLGHLYGFTLTAAGDGATNVEHYCDWEAFHPKLKDKMTWPVVPVHMLEGTLAKLDALATA